MSEPQVVIKLFLIFAYISLVSVGGTGSSFLEMQRIVVQNYHWMDDHQLIELYSLGQLVPGPNVFYSFLVGNHLAGWVGGFSALVGFVLPSCLLVIVIAWLAGSKNSPNWITRFFFAVRPVTIGLRLSSAWILSQSLGLYGAAIIGVASFIAFRNILSSSWLVILAALFGLGISLI